MSDVRPSGSRQSLLTTTDAGIESCSFRLLREMSAFPVVARFVVDGEPISKARARFTGYGSKTRAYTPARTLEGEAAVAAAFLRQVAGRPHQKKGQFGVTVVFFGFTRQRRDIDNMVKLLLDGLNGHAWDDDNQVVEVSARKVLIDDRDHARTEALVYYMGQESRRALFKCERCGSMFGKYPSDRSRRYCSTTCSGTALAARPLCRHCGAPTSGLSTKYCSQKCDDAVHTTQEICLVCATQFKRPRCFAKHRPLCGEECRALFWREQRLVAARGVCGSCGGPTSKKSYQRCRACVIGATHVIIDLEPM
jgi:crossover junction endodeoxyribonuclease RusA